MGFENELSTGDGLACPESPCGPLLSVIIPAYNEQATIDRLLDRVLAAAPSDKEVIVVDDGSTDGTSERVAARASVPHVHALHHGTNRGKGAAIRTGLALARGRFVIVQDADLEYDPADYERLLAPLRDGVTLIVFGSRYHPYSRMRGRPMFLFRAGVIALNAAVWILYRARLTDEATCYKAFDRRVLEGMDLQCSRFEFCPEVTAKACRMGLSIVEVPICYTPRDGRAGKKIRLADGIAALAELWKWRRWNPTRPYDLQSEPRWHPGTATPEGGGIRPVGVAASAGTADAHNGPVPLPSPRAVDPPDLARGLRRRSRGVTIVELLVVVAVIGLLLALMIPAVQAARESARRAQCQNNLKQIGVAVLQHEQAQRHLPSNGWGFLWIGQPDRGFGRRQPGGWIYNILPYLDATGLRSLGGATEATRRQAELGQLMGTPVAVFDCPSRPGNGLGPQSPAVRPVNAPWISPVAKTDYAINEGDYITDTREGPTSLQEGDHPSYRWKDVSAATGVSFLRSELHVADVEDGMAQTYLVGEKYLRLDAARTADDSSHDQCMYTGVDWDISRWTLHPPMRDNLISLQRRFGSAHAKGAHFLFGDGSVRMIAFDVDRETHRSLGNRRDGRPISPPVD